MNVSRLSRNTASSRSSDERGAVLVVMALLLMVFLGFVAVGLDVGYLAVVRNELQNAADAGALAGARDLYLGNGTAINPGTNQIAFDAATANQGMRIAVEVQDPLSNVGDVQRGHWSFATRTFTPNASTAPVDLWDVTFAELDTNPNFINAVRVVTRRQTVPTRTFFAGVLGRDTVIQQAEAIAYLGFAGNTEWDEVDQPIAICSRSIITNGNEYTCSRARMLDSSSSSTGNTAAWTNFSQEPCATASSSSVRRYTGCSGDPVPGLQYGVGMGTTGGTIDNALRDIEQCWSSVVPDTVGDGLPDQSWALTLPVITCSGNNPGNCETLVGVVEVEVLWVKRNNGFNDFGDIPVNMTSMDGTTFNCTYQAADFAGASSTETENMNRQCFQEFATAFNMADWEDTPLASVPDAANKKAIYFAPDCSPHIPSGRTGGVNFGVLARIPVLVN